MLDAFLRHQDDVRNISGDPNYATGILGGG